MSRCSINPAKRFMTLDQATETPSALTLMETISFTSIVYIIFSCVVLNTSNFLPWQDLVISEEIW